EGAGGAELDQTGAGGFGEGCGLSGVLATDAVVLLHQQQQRGLRQAHGVPGGHGPVVGDGGALAAQCGVQEPRGQGCAVLGGVLPEGGGGVQQVEGVLVVSEPVGDLVAVLFGEPLRVVLGGGGSQGGVGDSQQQPVCCGVFEGPACGDGGAGAVGECFVQAHLPHPVGGQGGQPRAGRQAEGGFAHRVCPACSSCSSSVAISVKERMSASVRSCPPSEVRARVLARLRNDPAKALTSLVPEAMQ